MPSALRLAVRAAVLAAALSLHAALAHAQGAPSPAAPPAQTPMPPFEQIIKMPVVYRRDGMDRARVHRDVVYRTVEGHPLKMDFYLPEGLERGSRLPAVVFISGASDAKNWAVFTSYGRLAAAHGMVGITFDKRYEMTQLVEGASDLEALLDYARTHATEHHVDPDRIALWAFSAGGRLLPVGMRGERPCLRALVNFYGITDLRPELEHYPEGVRDEVQRRLSALDLLEANPAAVPPVFIARAGRDGERLNAGIARFAEAALAANVPLELVNHPEGRHAFDILDDTDASRQVIRRAFEFVGDQLGTRGK